MLITLLNAILNMPFGEAKLWEGVRKMAKDMKKTIMPGPVAMQTNKIAPAKAVKTLPPVVAKQNPGPKSDSKGQETVGPVSAKPAARWYFAPPHEGNRWPGDPRLADVRERQGSCRTGRCGPGTGKGAENHPEADGQCGGTGSSGAS